MNTPLNILIVDDQPENLLALEAILRGLGHHLIRANSGREALRHALDHDLALILLDVQMPELDGFETARLIRERERSHVIPLIFLTAAMKTEEMVFKGYSSGAVDYLFKPIVPEILRMKVEVFLELATARQTLEEEVAHRKLADEQIRALNSELQHRADQLEVANKELEAFSYSVSHDLRAPLRGIDGFSQALLEDYADKLDQEGKEHLHRVRAASQRMGELIDDMLNLSRVTRAEMRREPVDLTGMAQALAAELQKSAPDREVEFVIADGLTAQGDARLLRIALDNLLGNAWKYTSKHPRARIEFGFAQNNGQSAYFVRDDGAGFDMAYADKLFGVFQRLHKQTEFSGTGVGLATVQRVIHRHGGKVWAEGKINEGATFYLTLSD